MNVANKKFLVFIVQASLVLSLLVDQNQAQDQYQSGFISIDCGISDVSTYIDKNTGITYSSDEDFTEAGENREISPDYTKYAIDVQQLSNLRSFPQGIRNCYALEPKQGKGYRYLIRASFLYGNYDNRLRAPTFDLYLGPNFWTTVLVLNSWTGYYSEIIHIPPSDHIDVCLVNTGYGTPFISALELRPINSEIYLTKAGTSLDLYNRHDFSSGTTDKLVRYKDDVYDRLWFSLAWKPKLNASTTDARLIKKNDFGLPSTVVSTAYTQNAISDSLGIIFSEMNISLRYFFYMHFTELEKLQMNQTRQFNIYTDNDWWYGPVNPIYLYTISIQSGSEGNKPNSDGKITVWLNNTDSATVPPIISAIEIYALTELPQQETNQTDVEAITKVKSVYGLKRIEWQGDPCAPETHRWNGLNCSYNNPPRIVSLNLSSSGLKGEIATSISNLSMLEYLDLSHNKLTGTVPETFSRLSFLKVLNLEGNNISGPIPKALSSKKDLEIRIDPYTCNINSTCPPSSKKKNTSFVIPLVASLGGALFVVLITVVVIWKLKKRRQKNVTDIRVENESGGSPSLGSKSVESKAIVNLREDNNEPVGSKMQQFTYSEIIRMTRNFEEVLGEGGFGKVYRGDLNGKEVAVKMLSSPSIQGQRQFQAELNLLMRVHHKNLTTLVGYCNEGRNIGLIYEYMAMGNLRSHISGNRQSILSWEDRLRIMIDIAQGLEYLHNGCKPPIIHRDVKSTNILLDEKLQAKLSDFGLSKMFPLEIGNNITTSDTPRITASIAGTPGYLDPEYYKTNRLNEKSDVYSFGVVLLEIITARPVLAKTRKNNHIIHWVGSKLAMGDIANIIDPKMEGICDINMVWKAIELAMACVSKNATNRPTMSQVTTELKDCLVTELARKNNSRDAADLSKDSSVEMISRILDNEFIPKAR